MLYVPVFTPFPAQDRFCEIALAKPYQSRLGRPEAAGTVKALKMRLEIDMQPFRPALTGDPHRLHHHFSRNALPAQIRMH